MFPSGSRHGQQKQKSLDEDEDPVIERLGVMEAARELGNEKHLGLWFVFAI